jgi:hypothetical protein
MLIVLLDFFVKFRASIVQSDKQPVHEFYVPPNSQLFLQSICMQKAVQAAFLSCAAS